MKQILFSVSIVGVAAFSLLLSPPAQAGYYKCVSAEGDTTYSQRPCPEDERTDKVISSNEVDNFTAANSESDTPDSHCSIAVKFAQRTADDMHNGRTSGQIFKQYGGLYATPGTTVALVNYVYTFRENYETTSERITGLVATRCQAGSFGPVSCKSFPKQFVSELGVCNTAQASNYPEPGYPSAFTNGSALELSAAKPATDNTERAVSDQIIDCQNRILQEVNVVTARMNGQTTAENEQLLREQHQTLRTQFNAC